MKLISRIDGASINKFTSISIPVQNLSPRPLTKEENSHWTILFRQSLQQSIYLCLVTLKWLLAKLQLFWISPTSYDIFITCQAYKLSLLKCYNISVSNCFNCKDLRLSRLKSCTLNVNISISNAYHSLKACWKLAKTGLFKVLTCHLLQALWSYLWN